MGFTKGTAPPAEGAVAVVSVATAGGGGAGWSLVAGVLLQAPSRALAVAMSKAGISLFMAGN